MNKVVVYTDGSSRGNPGPGGFSAIVRIGDFVKEIGGKEDNTTNNRMELLGAIKAFEFLNTQKDLGEIIVHSDSQYVVKGITSWVFNWQKNGWRTASKKPVENKDLWERLFSLTSQFSVTWKYVEGHAGIKDNERCDEIATSFALDKEIKLL